MTVRLTLAGGLVAIVVVVVFAELAHTIADLQRQTTERRAGLRLLIAADALQKSVLDLETGARAFVITRQDRLLEPWRNARDQLPRDERRLLAAIGMSGYRRTEALALARRIHDRVDSYLYGHSLPLVQRVRARRADHRQFERAVARGKARVDELRALFARLRARETAQTDEQTVGAERAARRAVALGVGGLVLILGAFAGGIAYLTRAVTRPVARVAQAAGALAAGRLDRHARVSGGAHGSPEVRLLTESFDAMADVVRAQSERLQSHNTLLARRVNERTADLEMARYEGMLMLAVATEYRDEDTHEHTRRVGRNAALLAERLGLSEESIELLAAAAPLHDVGKIGIADAIMFKAGRLTSDEFELMKRHVTIGATILGSSSEPIFHIASQIALTHHERWDGGGYPNGLAGEAIPLGGRIVAVLDVFDALTHSRPYKEAWSIDRAVAEIRGGAGSQFDPDVVAAFEDIDASLLLAAT